MVRDRSKIDRQKKLSSDAPKSAAQERRERSAEALRANLRRRKKRGKTPDSQGHSSS